MNSDDIAYLQEISRSMAIAFKGSLIATPLRSEYSNLSTAKLGLLGEVFAGNSADLDHLELGPRLVAKLTEDRLKRDHLLDSGQPSARELFG